jgi:hypothetical protein
MRHGLDARAQEGQVAGVLARQGARGHAGHRGRADGRDRAGVHEGEQPAVAGVEEQHRALVGVVLGALVAGEDGDRFQPDGGRLCEVGGHYPESASAARQPQHRAQREQGLTVRQRAQDGGHRVHALGHGQQPWDLVLADHEDAHTAGGYIAGGWLFVRPAVDSESRERQCGASPCA